MAEYKGTSQEGARHQKLERAREKMMQDFEQQRIQIAKDHEVKAAADKFVVQHSNVEEALKQSTIGLVHLKDFQKVRLELEELKKREAAQTNKLQERVVKKKAKKVISKLSFADDEEEEESSTASSPKDIKGKKRAQDDDDDTKDSKSPSTPPSEPTLKKSKFGKDPNIDTSFLPDREREEEERRVREELRQEWLAKQQKIKNETIQITYSYWDGSGHRKEVECKKGDTIAQFLEKCRQQFQQLRGVSIDNMMYVKEDLIIPHHYTFYDFIINKARGKSGPLFSFDVHEDIRLTNDAGVEKDESHAGKVVERSYYERNKHIFPLSRFEIYDPEKSYGKYSIKGNAK
ncbi:XAP5-domain-containing protein [Linnemannia elongata AG-77]|uniref:XAP5-domain-containing protein n=1 Tax=Linnemannia elongata AG-77 TaxID=1314771 RepID=A0A197JXC7_9FUNG|nr:XAP5-domain-containing protein [Linnemannia elongata AG-77]